MGQPMMLPKNLRMPPTVLSLQMERQSENGTPLERETRRSGLRRRSHPAGRSRFRRSAGLPRGPKTDKPATGRTVHASHGRLAAWRRAQKISASSPITTSNPIRKMIPTTLPKNLRMAPTVLPLGLMHGLVNGRARERERRLRSWRPASAASHRLAGRERVQPRCCPSRRSRTASVIRTESIAWITPLSAGISPTTRAL